MNKFVELILLFLLLSFCQIAAAQTINQKTLLRLVKAEDERRFDEDLQNFMRSPDAAIRQRAALAAGRIGDEAAIEFLTNLLAKDASAAVRSITVFALGEIESIQAADVVRKTLQNAEESVDIRARALEAAGKIAAANAKDEKAKDLGEAILDVLETEYLKTNRQRDMVLFGLTAALRARPADADFVIAKFLSDKDARIRADAANAMARLRAQNANIAVQLRALLLTDDEPIVRANAARALGAAEDKSALDLLIEAAISDDDERVRVSAIRSLALLKDKKAADPLLERGEKLFALYKTVKSKFPNPSEKNELLEIAASLGRLLQNSNQEKAKKMLVDFRELDNFSSTEIDVALARIAPKDYYDSVVRSFSEYLIENAKLQKQAAVKWRTVSTVSQGVAELANFEGEDKQKLTEQAIKFPKAFLDNKNYLNAVSPAAPDVLRAFAAFKTNDLSAVLREHLASKDIYTRAAAAELLSGQPASNETVAALKNAFIAALASDKNENDAQLAILSALVKLDKNESVETLKTALAAPDYLVRRHAAQLVKQNDLNKELPNVDEKAGFVKPQHSASQTKLGQIFYRDADYARAISRQNGQAKAILTTEKGSFTSDFFPEDSPLAVDNFIQLANSGYFNNVAVHRVVPNFVMQDGDPRGDGNGGPGWQIRCEINQIRYDRGAVGMALSGKDTGGSQWFVTHSPQPHLDGGYTVFGRVNEADMKIVDKIARGDKILNVKIVEEDVSRKNKQTARK